MLTLPAMKHHSSGCAGGFVLRIPAMRAMELSDAVAWSRCLMATSWREWRTPSRPNEVRHMMAVVRRDFRPTRCLNEPRGPNGSCISQP